jgi:DNA-binding FrmR family transcriptional regulator
VGEEVPAVDVLRAAAGLAPRNADTRGAPARRTGAGTPAKADRLARLTRIEARVDRVIRMVEADLGCVAVLDEIAAVNKALRLVAVGLLTEQLRQCVAHSLSGNPEAAAAGIQRATLVIALLVRG